MNQRNVFSRRGLRLLAPALGVTVMFAGALPAQADAPPQPVTRWVERHAAPLRSLDPAAPLCDLAPLRRSIGAAQIVGLGESSHGVAEQTTLKHRTVRFLVERMGFRSIAWEDDWTIGLKLNRYIRRGTGDLSTLMNQMSTAWQTREVADVLRWLRDYNAGHRDKVQFFGVEYFSTRPLAYDAVEAYVARHAPQRLPELRRHLEAVRPYTSDMGKYVQWYWNEVADKAPYTRHARAVYDLVSELSHRPGERSYAVTLHHARQIRSFYEHFALPFEDTPDYRDAHTAANLRWWRELSGDKVAYWAASPHTANAPNLRMTVPPPGEDMRFASAGSYLRRWYGDRYRSIGFTFDHGTVSLGSDGTVDMPPPKPGWFEHPFGAVGYEQFAVDLRRPAPPAVRRWLDAPIRTRGLADAGPDAFMDGGTLAQWFDIVVHRQEVSPARSRRS